MFEEREGFPSVVKCPDGLQLVHDNADEICPEEGDGEYGEQPFYPLDVGEMGVPSSSGFAIPNPKVNIMDLKSSTYNTGIFNAKTKNPARRRGTIVVPFCLSAKLKI